MKNTFKLCYNGYIESEHFTFQLFYLLTYFGGGGQRGKEGTSTLHAECKHSAGA